MDRPDIRKMYSWSFPEDAEERWTAIKTPWPKKPDLELTIAEAIQTLSELEYVSDADMERARLLVIKLSKLLE